MSQPDRTSIISDFTTGIFNILVSTDIVARGMDQRNLTQVINYDIPENIESYVGRIGRIGAYSSKRKKIATSFISHTDTTIMYDLLRTLSESCAKIPKELSDHPMALVRNGGNNARNIVFY